MLNSDTISKKCYAKAPLCLSLEIPDSGSPASEWARSELLSQEISRLNTGEAPIHEVKSSLLSVLDPVVPNTYLLTPKSCLGILRRAEARGKELPPLLKKTLVAQSNQNTELPTSTA